ncbi:hypothetical protein Salat_1811600 [Sesamum alatum]|uniref:Transmembrane protein n=1 Tax=Sesamum alatum TaxID=300844 RepID=A0AAE1Y3B1_9LAMI|nr:hypothetical protein Salat_1811600 [Sesamum alatum]
MVGGDTTALEGCTTITAPLRLIREVARISTVGFWGFFKKDCADLARRVFSWLTCLKKSGIRRKSKKMLKWALLLSSVLAFLIIGKGELCEEKKGKDNVSNTKLRTL